MSNRPLRDIPPSVNYQGQAARAWGRVDKGLDALASGNTAIRRGLDMLTEVAAERAARLQRVEEEVTGARAETEFRRRFGESLRQLDPNEADYTDRVQALFNETAQAINQEFQFRGQIARERFGVRLENIRTQATLQALDARERAVAERAEIEINQRLNGAAAAVTANPGMFPAVLAQFEADIGGLVAGFDANRRDRVLQAARERLATDYVRTLVANRQFRQAEEAFRTLGPQNMLSASAISSLRAAMVAERRQAESEARQARAEAYQSALLSIQEASVLVDQGGTVLDRQRAIEGAEQAVAAAARMFGADSVQTRRLNLALQRLAYSARDRGAEVIESLRARATSGDALNEREQAQYVLASQSRAADAAEMALPPDASLEERMQARQQAAAEARGRAISELIATQPGGRIPIIEYDLAQARRRGPDAFAATLADVASRGYGVVPAVTDTVNRDPTAFLVMQRLQAEGRQPTADNIRAVLAGMPQVSPEVREARRAAFEQEYVRPPRQGAEPPGWSQVNSALRAVSRDATATNADRQVMLEAAGRLVASGMEAEEAFRVAAQQHVARSLAQVPGARADGQAAASMPMRREFDPMSVVPGEVARLYGEANVRQALAERGAALFREMNARLPEGERIPADRLSAVTVVPVLREGQIAYMASASVDGRTFHAIITDENGQPVVDTPNVDFFHEGAGLRRRLEEARRAGGRQREEAPRPPAPLSPAATAALPPRERLGVWANWLARGEVPEGVTGREISEALFGDPDRRPSRQEFRTRLRESIPAGVRRPPPSDPLWDRLYHDLYPRQAR